MLQVEHHHLTKSNKVFETEIGLVFAQKCEAVNCQVSDRSQTKINVVIKRILVIHSNLQLPG